MVCSFFGHRDCPGFIKSKLFEAIEKQIKDGTTQFYVGNHGNFDAMVLSCLRRLKHDHAEIHDAVVLAYLPTDPAAYLPGETVFPEGIEQVPRRFAINFRNRWMIDCADTVICYFFRSWGGTAKNVGTARKKGAIILNLAEK